MWLSCTAVPLLPCCSWESQNPPGMHYRAAVRSVGSLLACTAVLQLGVTAASWHALPCCSWECQQPPGMHCRAAVGSVSSLLACTAVLQ